MKRRVAAKLPSTASGVELLDYLSGRFAYHSREDWCQKIHDGELALDGAVCRDPQRVLCSNSLLEYFPQNLEEPAVNCDYQIIYEDECLLVIDKPGNLPVHPAGPYFAHTLWALLHDAGYEKIHFVNRLDRETSGLMIAAKNSDAASTLASALPEMVKTYQVVVHGTFPEELTAVGFLAHDERSGIRKKQRFFTAGEELPPSGKMVECETRFRCLQYRNELSLLAAELKTGRMHQIRATLCSLGFPVAGDKLYGLDEQFYRRLALDTLSSDDWSKLLLKRQALHCSGLIFPHPSDGRMLTFDSALPAEIAVLLG